MTITTKKSLYHYLLFKTWPLYWNLLSVPNNITGVPHDQPSRTLGPNKQPSVDSLSHNTLANIEGVWTCVFETWTKRGGGDSSRARVLHHSSPGNNHWFALPPLVSSETPPEHPSSKHTVLQPTEPITTLYVHTLQLLFWPSATGCSLSMAAPASCQWPQPTPSPGVGG